ncbi:MAG TPA: hypothetical protein ENJ35_03690 [Gammaproteobacteria bacterium]|nr:hypothetical protein [Gammaproteobacteria bacterium]
MTGEQTPATSPAEDLSRLARIIGCIVASLDDPVRYDQNFRHTPGLLEALFPQEERHDISLFTEALTLACARGRLGAVVKANGDLMLFPGDHPVKWHAHSDTSASIAIQRLYRRKMPVQYFVGHLTQIVEAYQAMHNSDSVSVTVEFPSGVDVDELISVYDDICELADLPPAYLESSRQRTGCREVVFALNKNDQLEIKAQKASVLLTKVLGVDKSLAWRFDFSHETSTFIAVLLCNEYYFRWEQKLDSDMGNARLRFKDYVMDRYDIDLNEVTNLAYMQHIIQLLQNRKTPFEANLENSELSDV